MKLIKIFSPISGNIVNIEDVPDFTFSKKIVGDGVAVDPIYGDKIVSPVNGKIKKIFKTKHAFSILSEDGIELLVHFGIDTVKLNGKGFDCIYEENKIVKKGTTIIKFDLSFLKKNVKSVLTPIIIFNIELIKKIKKFSGKVIAGENPIIFIYK